jgi:NAD(P)-dependent dehydrogenase (short-subunit alcohol dehydrogenase family)
MNKNENSVGEKKVVMITGASSGIGRVTARELAKTGATVIMACRNQAAAETAAEEIKHISGNDDIFVVPLDLASFASVRGCAALIAERWDKIDVLVNNAGTYTQGDTLTADGIHPTMQTNYFSPFLLTNLLIPLLAASGSSRIVNVTSAMYRIGVLNLEKPGFIMLRNGFSAYAASKLALLLFTMELSDRLTGKGITGNALHPGLVNTKIMTLRKWYDFFIRYYIDRRAIGVEEGAATSIYLAASPEVDGISGKYFSECKEVMAKIAPNYLAMKKTLWEKTSEVVAYIT